MSFANTHRVPGLLSEDLSQGNDVRIVAQRLRQIDHVIGGILLITRASGSKEGSKSGDGDRVALLTTTSGVL